MYEVDLWLSHWYNLCQQFSASKESFISLDRILIYSFIHAGLTPALLSQAGLRGLLVSAFQVLGLQAKAAKCLILIYSGLGGVPQSRD